MKTVALHTDFRIYWPARLKRLSDELRKRGDTLTVIEIAGRGSAYAFSEETAKDALDWICLFPNDPIETLNPSATKKAVMDKLDDLNPDVVMAGAIAFTSGAAAVDWAKRRHKAVVIFDDSKKEDVKRNRIVDTIKKIIYSHVDAVFCPSADWLDTYTYWGFRKQAVFYGVDVVDNAFWQANEVEKRLELPEKYLLAVGRQIERKNFRTLIEAFIQLTDNGQNTGVSLLLAGEGTERSSLEKSIPEKYRSIVRFYPFQDQTALRVMYRHALAFILPSRSDQWGLVVNEAMASGLPVIVSRRCGCANSLVVEGENGFVFSPENRQELISCMEKIIKRSQESLSGMRAKSREIIRRWDLDRFSQGAVDAMDYAVRNKRRPFFFVCKYVLAYWKGRYNVG
jgi:glycosyltransferase involved in cell wall biosynthesis